MSATPLSAAAITAALTTHRLGRPTLFYPSIGSTNDVCHEQAAAGAAEGLLVVADEQMAGRGRLDRRWWAPRGSSLLMSLLLRPPIPPTRAAQLTMCLGLGAAEGIEQVTGLRPALKWPNDLLLDGRKLGGMLTELRLAGERIEYAVLGIGINVHVEFAAPGVPPEIAETAISLAMALANVSGTFGSAWHVLDRATLLAAILARCEAWYDRLLAGESPHGAWAARLDTLGRLVTVTLPAGVLRGIATGVNAEGALLVRDDGGQVHTVWAGDVTAVR